MNKILVLACACFAAGSAFALPDYEPFSDSTGSGGTSYTVGDNLIGQVNSSGSNWITAGPAGVQPTIAAGDLNISGLYTTGGGRSAAFGGNGTSARLNLSVDATGIQAGTVYFSFALKLTDISTLTSGGTFFAGFNNNQAPQTTTPNTIVTRVMARSATGGYNIGLREGTGAANGNLAWGSTVFTTSDVLFLVGSYTFNGAALGTDDSSSLWINPDSSTFGAASAPSGALVSSGGVDIARIASFTLYNQSAAEPLGVIDNLRFGTSWADVTPPAIPEPSTLAIVGLGLTALIARRTGRKPARFEKS